MTRIGLIPLDDRPVSTTDPVLLAQLAGAEVLMPPLEILGHRNQAGDTEALGLWWLDNASAVDGWVVSLDMLLYGGLVASRVITEPLDTILDRLKTLQAVHKLAPDIPIYAFQSIRRLAVTVSTSDDLSFWTETHSGASPLDKERKRNHLVNLAVLEQAANGSLDVLNFLQEDARVDGPQGLEHTVLQEKIQHLNLSDKVTITTGCDEGAMVLVASLLNRKKSVPEISYSSEAGAMRIPLYEDRPLRDTVAGQLNALGISSGEKADTSVCLIWCPDRPCQDRMLGSIAEESSDFEVAEFMFKLKGHISAGQKVVIADVADANGADPKLMSALQKEDLLRQLYGFAAWNTAANTIGTALAQAVLPLSSQEFCKRRLIEDWGYQTVLRPKLAAKLSARGADIWRLGTEELAFAEKYLNEEMERFAEALGYRVPLVYGLPWERVFEISLTPQIACISGGLNANSPCILNANPPCVPPLSGGKNATEKISSPLIRGDVAKRQRGSNSTINHYDVIVCGAGTSGICAAIAAGRRGAKTCLIEESNRLGGTITRCLVNPLMTFHSEPFNPIITGIPQEIIDRLVAIGGSPGHLPDPIGVAASMTIVDPVLFEQVVRKMLEEAGVEVILGTEVVELPSAKLIIDATGDADIAVLAGAEVTTGRPGDGKSQPMTLLFTMDNINTDEIRTYIQKYPDEFVLSDLAKKDLSSFPKLAVSGFFKQVRAVQEQAQKLLFRDRVLAFELNTPNAMLINMTRVLGFDGAIKSEREAAYELGLKQVNEVAEFLVKNIPGFSGAKLQQIAEAIGVRESRHLVGRYELSAADVLSGRQFKDGVACGSFPIDIHSPDGRGVVLTPVSEGKAYQIPLRSMQPKGIEGLLVTGRCISASHEASASARLTATCMALGEAAGSVNI